MSYYQTTVAIPLTGGREIRIPANMTQEEADYFASWFKIWISLPIPEPLPQEEKQQ